MQPQMLDSQKSFMRHLQMEVAANETNTCKPDIYDNDG